MDETRILVVEDEASIAEVVSLYLKRAGFQVQIASDGRQAIALFERQAPDFVILDLMLPQMDGLSLTRWLRDRSNVPIIMLTARREETESGNERELSFAGLSIDPLSRVVKVMDTEVELTAKEFDMLHLLARHPRQVFTREQLLDRVWGGAQYIDPGTVTVHVRRLR